MTKKHLPLVIANWKMNPGSLSEAKKLFLAIRNAAKKLNSVTTVVAPPFVYISDLQKLSPAGSVTLGAQNVHEELQGAHTGEVSINMLSGLSVRYVIVGHSERRANGETDAQVAKKVELILKARSTPIVCVGERERDVQGNFYVHIEKQLLSALTGIAKSRHKDVVIAYEPIWAIGTGATATPEDVVEMQLFIHKTLAKHFGRTTAATVRVIYGGSVNADNAAALYGTGAINGFLVGGASLKPAEFSRILSATL